MKNFFHEVNQFFIYCFEGFEKQNPYDKKRQEYQERMDRYVEKAKRNKL